MAPSQRELSPPLAAVTERVCGSGGLSCSQWVTCSVQDPFLFRSGRKRNGSWTPKRKAGRGCFPCTPRYRWERDAFYSRPNVLAGPYPDGVRRNSLHFASAETAKAPYPLLPSSFPIQTRFAGFWIGNAEFFTVSPTHSYAGSIGTGCRFFSQRSPSLSSRAKRSEVET